MAYSTDTFDRTNSATTLGSTDGAGTLDPLTWTALVGTWGINTNRAYCPTPPGGSNDGVAYVDLTHGDVDISLTVTTTSADSGIAFRISDSTHYWVWENNSSGTQLFKRNSTFTQVGTTHAGVANGDVLRVVASGSSIQCYRNGSLLETQTDSFNSTATKHGLNSYDSTTRLDSWTASAPATTTPQSLSVTQTQTPTLSTALTIPQSLSVTQTQTATLGAAGPTITNKTLSVTQTQTATLGALGGHKTAASGSETAPTYVLKTVGMTGGSPVTLTNAEPDTVTWTLNAPDEYTFHFPKNAYTAADIPVLGTVSGVREVQLYRNGDLLTWGPVVQAQVGGRDGAVQCHGFGVDWYLNRRFVDGPIPNLITNPDFESGTASWTASNCTFTASTDNFVTGAHSAKLVVASPGTDSQIHQNSISVGPNGVGILITLSAWVFVSTFTAAAFGGLGLYIEGGPTGSTDTINNYYPIDNATPRGKWIKTSTTLQVPPGEVWDINVRLYGPQGTTYWDDVKLVAMDSVSTAGLTGSVNTPVDIAQIIQQLVAHEQMTSKGKSALNIGTRTETTGVKMAKSYQYVDHVQFDQALLEFLNRDDGADYSMDYTPTTRTFHSYANKRGTDRTASVTLTYNPAAVSNCTDYRFANDGGSCITRSTVLGEDNGPDREQGETVDASRVGGLILQDVRQSPQNTKTASLQPLSAEILARYSTVPVTIEMDIVGSAGLIPTLQCGDLVTVALVDGYVQIAAPYRIMRLMLDCKTNILSATVTVDSL